MIIELYVFAVAAFIFGTIVGAGIVYYIQSAFPKVVEDKKAEPLTAFGARPATDADFELVRSLIENGGK